MVEELVEEKIEEADFDITLEDKLIATNPCFPAIPNGPRDQPTFGR